MGYSKAIDKEELAKSFWENYLRYAEVKVKESDNVRVTEDTNKTWSGTSETDLYQITSKVQGKIKLKVKIRKTAGGSDYGANIKVYKNESLLTTLINTSYEWVIKSTTIEVAENDIIKLTGYCTQAEVSGECDTVYLCYDLDVRQFEVEVL